MCTDKKLSEAARVGAAEVKTPPTSILAQSAEPTATEPTTDEPSPDDTSLDGRG